MENDFDVDLVYLWCDGQDPKFAKQKDFWLKKEGKNSFTKQAIAAGRFEQVDELKYSLRSVEKFLPWIHHIFIVTANQIPTWLDTNHPKISIVDHRDIIPNEYLPTFNSTLISAATHKIPKLSEHFLLANDDTFIYQPIDKVFFFPAKDKINLRIKRRNLFPKSSLYDAMLCNVLSSIRRDFGTNIPFISQNNIEPHHNIDAYLKSDCIACERHFNKEYQETLSHRFREPTDLLRFVVNLYSFVHHRAILKFVPNWTNDDKEATSVVDSLYFSNRDWEIFDKILKKYDPFLFCINDDEFAKPSDRIHTKNFLEKLFPDKSGFEKN